MGVKDRRTKILLFLMLVGEESFQPVIFDERMKKVTDLTFNQKTKGVLSSMLKDGVIEKVGVLEKDETDKAPTTYRLTQKGFYELCLRFPFFRFLKEKWDGKWRIISYEIPESKRYLRDRLRREMEGWGLGPWHRSFWLTPHPVIPTLRDLVFGREEEQYIQAFEAEHVFGDREILIEKVWERTKLDKSYRSLFKTWHSILSSKEEKVERFSKIITAYVKVLKFDPGLPIDLLGQNWIGYEGWKIFGEIKKILY